MRRSAGLQQLLKGWGYVVDVASDGREALAKIAQDRPAIVLSDLVMPNLGGLDLLKSLKQNRRHGRHGGAADRRRASVESAVEAIKQGAYDYVTKPIDPQRLRIVLDQISARNDTLREVRALRRQLQRARVVRQDDRRQPGDAEDLPDRSSRRRRRRRPCSCTASPAPARSWSRRRFIS